MANILTWAAGELLSSVRTKLNANFTALNTDGNYLSATAPTSPSVGQIWTDTTNGLVMQRNAQNTAWLPINRIWGASVLTVSTNKTLTQADFGRLLVCTSGVKITLPTVAQATENWHVIIRNSSSAAVTIAPGSMTIDWLTSLVLPPGYNVKIYCTGGLYFTDLSVTYRHGTYTVNVTTANVSQAWNLSFDIPFAASCYNAVAVGAGYSLGAWVEVSGTNTTGLTGFVQKPATGNLTFRYIAMGK